MRDRRNRSTVIRIIAIIVSVAAIAGIAAVLYFGDLIKIPAQKESAQTETETETVSPSEISHDAEPLDTVFFVSDYQIMPGWDTPAENLTAILRAVKKAGKEPTNVVFCGDYTNDSRLSDYELSPDASIQEIKNIIASECSSVSEKDLIFEQGNHDQLTDAITPTGLYEYENYYVYVLNTQYDFPWKQGKKTEYRDRVIQAAENLKTSLNGLIDAGETRPVFIAGHVPLHFTAKTSSRFTTGDNMYSSYIFDAVNSCAEFLDIIYFTGHNHSKGWDCYMGGSCIFKVPGDTILIPDAEGHSRNTDSFNEKTLNFTYMNAGYVGFYINCSPKDFRNGNSGNYRAADETLTGTVCEILPTELVLSRYSPEGIHPLCGDGDGNPYRGNIDASLISENYYSMKRESPVHIERKALISKIQIF